MAQTNHSDLRDDRPSGVPEPHHLGDASKEMWWLIIGLVVLAAIAIAFVMQSLG